MLGRHDWLHVGQEAGGEKAANLFSLMITCKRLKVEPYAYLLDVLRRLPSHSNKDLAAHPSRLAGNVWSKAPARSTLRLRGSEVPPDSFPHSRRSPPLLRLRLPGRDTASPDGYGATPGPICRGRTHEWRAETQVGRLAVYTPQCTLGDWRMRISSARVAPKPTVYCSPSAD